MNQMDGVESSCDTYVVGLDSAAAQLHQTLVNTQVMIFTNRVMLVNINKPFMKYEVWLLTIVIIIGCGKINKQTMFVIYT